MLIIITFSTVFVCVKKLVAGQPILIFSENKTLVEGVK